MKKVKEALEHAFNLAKQEGVILHSVQFESRSEFSTYANKESELVRLTSLKLDSELARGEIK